MYEFLEYRVLDAMTTKVETLRPEATLAEAERFFAAHDFNAAPVVDAQGRFVGFFSKLDLLRAFRTREDETLPPYDAHLREPVSAHMQREVHVVQRRTKLTKVLDILVDERRKSLPVVVDDDRVIGMISREDVLAALRRAAAGEKPRGPI